MLSRNEASDVIIAFAPPEIQNELRKEDREASKAIDSYVAFKERLARSEHGTRRDPVFASLVMSLMRMSENLEGCRLCVLGGRNPVAMAALRMLYESYTNLLLIGFHNGPIPRDRLNRNLSPTGELGGDVTREYLAERFLGFGVWANFQHLDRRAEYSPEDWAAFVAEQPGGAQDYDRRKAAMKVSADAVQARFHFDDRHTLSWHPFSNARAVKNHLWPPEGDALFPAGKLRVTRVYWDAIFSVAYKHASHEIHGSPASLMFDMAQRSPEFSQVQDRPFYDPEILRLAYGLFLYGTVAFAEVFGLVDDWNAAFS